MRKNEKWGWKVLHMWRGKLRSATVPWKFGGVIYKEDQWTFPRKGCGPLCVFATRKAAAAMEFVGVLLVRRVKYVPSPSKAVWRIFDSLNSPLSSLPEKTRLAEAVFVSSKETP